MNTSKSVARLLLGSSVPGGQNEPVAHFSERPGSEAGRVGILPESFIPFLSFLWPRKLRVANPAFNLAAQVADLRQLNVVVFGAHDGAAAVLQAQVVEKYVQVFGEMHFLNLISCPESRCGKTPDSRLIFYFFLLLIKKIMGTTIIKTIATSIVYALIITSLDILLLSSSNSIHL
jgi:hypothetical protein